MKPLVSIIIPTYNRAHLIVNALDSILAQTYNNWECIIVDDGSTDNTDLVIGNYVSNDSRFQYHHRPENKQKGPNSCRNYGFELSKGSWVNWFDSDDIYYNNALEEFINNVEPDLDLVVAKLVKIDSVTNEIVGYNRVLSSNLLTDYYTGLLSFYVCGPLWNKFFLNKQKEFFDENIRFLDDWDFNLRMLYQKPKIKFVDKILIKYIIDSNSLSNQIYKLNRLEIKSEINAREKQLNIIHENKLIDSFVCLKFTRDRYKAVLIDCLINNHKDKKWLLFKMMRKNIEMRDFKSFTKGIIGYISCSTFNKGYCFFK